MLAALATHPLRTRRQTPKELSALQFSNNSFCKFAFPFRNLGTHLLWRRAAIRDP